MFMEDLHEPSVRLYLVDRGLDMDPILCPNCSNHFESVYHLMFACEVGSPTWLQIAHCWDFVIPNFSFVTDLLN